MAKYLAWQIHNGALEYDAVVAKFPKYKKQIDEWLEYFGD